MRNNIFKNSEVVESPGSEIPISCGRRNADTKATWASSDFLNESEKFRSPLSKIGFNWMSKEDFTGSRPIEEYLTLSNPCNLPDKYKETANLSNDKLRDSPWTEITEKMVGGRGT